jgi:hypothetical protein
MVWLFGFLCDEKDTVPRVQTLSYISLIVTCCGRNTELHNNGILYDMLLPKF